VSYDVRQMPDVFRMLERVSQEGSSGGRLPEWLSTHPEPEHRIERIEDNVRTAINNAGELRVGRDTYLKQLEGLVFGQDPREGFVRGGRFYHPGLRFSIDVPENWKTQNTREALVMASPDQDALIQLSAAKAEDPEQALNALGSQEGVKLGKRVPDVVSGLRSASAEIEVTTQDQGVLSGLITFVILGGHTFQLLGLEPQAAGKDRIAEFARVQGTFKPVSDRSVLAATPARIHVIEVPDDTTLPVLYGRQPASIPLERIALLNQMKQDGGLKRGELVKWVTGGSIPQEDGSSE
jgi:predicted Zn-dependent protease